MVDQLVALAESHHMDKCVDAAFVGTAEAAAEPDSPGIDGIFSPEDEAKEDPTDVHDDEQDLLEKIPLPGSPKSEQQRKKIWLALPRRARIAIRRLHRTWQCVHPWVCGYACVAVWVWCGCQCGCGCVCAGMQCGGGERVDSGGGAASTRRRRLWGRGG